MLAARAWALDSSDLLFHLSFDDGIQAEFARGGSQPVAQPEELTRRIVDGLMGKGYLFAGKGSSIEYFVGEQGGRRCAESYGPKLNLFPDSGTVAFWVKVLTNAHNQSHWYFDTNPGLLSLNRNQYWQHGFSYASNGGIFYDSGEMEKSPWHFIVMTWRKDELCAYLNSHLMAKNTQCNVGTQAPGKFRVAAQAEAYVDFQKPGHEDDSVLDEFMLFRRPLTAEEVRSLFERAHVTTKQALPGEAGDKWVTNPERAYATNALVAPMIATPVNPDGKLDDWKDVPAHGCFTERRVAVLDDDASKVYVAHDAGNLYVGFRCPVDEALHNDPTHVMYPTGQFLANTSARDGDVYADDYVEFAIRNKDGHTYRFALNAKGALFDSRDGDRSWNADAKYISRSDFTDWTAEFTVPLAQLGLAAGDVADFNVIRSWKLSESSQNSLCPDAQSQPGWGKLTLGTSASASLESLGRPDRGELIVTGSIVGPAGDYTVKVRGKGYNQEFTEERKTGPGRFEIKRRLDKTGDLGLVVQVLDPAGANLLTRSVPFVFVPVSAVELMKYPGWDRLQVKVSPLNTNGVHATVELMSSSPLQRTEIPAFTNPDMFVTFDTKPLATGDCQVATRLLHGDSLIGEDRQPYTKKPLPEWYHCNAGKLDGPPIPWTDVKVRGGTIKLLLKDITFRKSLFPSEIISNGEKLLASPIRLRVKRDGQEKVLTAGDFKITKKTRRQVDWTATARDGELKVVVTGWIEFDGFTWMDITASGGKVEHLGMEIPFRPDSATLQTVGGADYGYVGTNRWKCYPTWGGYWIGNEKAALGYFWEHQRDWVWNGETPTLTPGAQETVLAFPFIQKATDLTKPRSFDFGWGIAPFKPVRADRRIVQLYKGVTYTWSVDYSMTSPNYPMARWQFPRDEPWLKLAWAELAKPDSQINCWYAFGASAWPGSPEYADWWREWRYTPSPSSAPPDPNSHWVAPACHNSSAMDLHVWLLEKYVKQWPQRGIYFDCMTTPVCDNEAHGCGFVGDDGLRRPSQQWLATRRYYERVRNIIKAADPKYGWVRHHLWGVDFTLWPFCDDDWIGEGYCGPLAGNPKHNYHDLLDLPHARMLFNNKRWGTEVSFLTEMGVSASVTGGPDEWYGRIVTPAKDGQHGEMIMPRWKDYEHVAGLAIVHDMWQVGGNDLELPAWWLFEIERMMRWDDKVKFVGYWEASSVYRLQAESGDKPTKAKAGTPNDDWVDVEGGVKDKIVCSLYYRPPGSGKSSAPEMRWPDPDRYRDFGVSDETKKLLRTTGENDRGWLILAPMNNTDEDVAITLKPNLRKLGFASPRDASLRDLYRAFDWTWHWPTGEKVNTPFRMKGVNESFPLTESGAKVEIPKRSFRMLLLCGHE